jgi:AcrR family transcriptional regulator
LPRDERRAQIVEAVLDVVAEHGVGGATVSRIAAAASVSEGTLYVYFPSRDDMLVAALDSIFMDMSNLIDSAPEMNAADRLADIARRHSLLMQSERRNFAIPWVEFIAAGSQVGLREAVAQTQTKAFEKVLKIVRHGQDEGTIRRDLDPRRLTWQWYTIMWAENVSTLMGLPEYIDAGHSAYSLELLLRDAAIQESPNGNGPS